MPRGRPTTIVPFRMTFEHVARLDTVVEALNEMADGKRLTRTDFILNAVIRAITQAENRLHKLNGRNPA